MSRRNPDAPRGGATLESRVAAQFSIAPGEVTQAAIEAYARMHSPKAKPEAAREDQRPLASLLDGYEWARSWGSFLAAVRDPRDGQGARAAIDMVRNAWSERVPSEGGFLVPETLRSEILALMTTAIVRPRAQYIPMGSLRESVPFLENANQSTAGQALAGLTFAITEEGAAFTATNPQFGRTTLQVTKVGAYLKNVPNELLADSAAFTDVFLPLTIARGLAFFEDDLFIASGNGADQPEALVNAPAGLAVTRVNSGQAPVHEDLVGMMKGLHPASWATAAWLLSASAFNAVLDMYLAVGSPTTQAVTPSLELTYDVDKGYWRLHGIPCFPNDHQPAAGTAGDVMLGDLSLYLVGDRGAMTVEVSSKGAGFAADTSNIRIRHRVDGRFWPQSAYTTKASQSVSPLVVLT